MSLEIMFVETAVVWLFLLFQFGQKPVGRRSSFGTWVAVVLFLQFMAIFVCMLERSIRVSRGGRI